jgi:predicted ATPase/DNA-binding CsgD family transcriptional regulator
MSHSAPVQPQLATSLSSSAHRDNLPAQLTPLIGREKERADVARLLREEGVRLLTLTGPPGIGKTRLSIQVASDLVRHFHDGVHFVPLASITDPTLVPSAIGQHLDIRQTGQHSLSALIAERLRDKELLLLLDNFEQVVRAGPLVKELLAACPHLKVLVTSRQALRVTGEHEFPVPPLKLPGQADYADVVALSRYEAVSLFAQRARAVKPDFTLTGNNASAVARICIQLDGLPLAIELAAARVKLLPPQAMLLRLAHGSAILASGAQDLPARQQTLHNAIAWSYDLLSDEERVLFRRLGVFVGGWTLEVAEAVCNEPGEQRLSTLEGLALLLDKSLVKPELAQGQEPDAGGEPRFTMLETILEYAREKLAESGEQQALKRMHAVYFANLAEQAGLKVWGPNRDHGDAFWLDRLEREHDNIRAALDWSHSSAADIEIELRLLVAVGRFWENHGYLREGRERLAAALSRPESREDRLKSLRAWALAQVEGLAYWQGDIATARSNTEEAFRLFTELGEQMGIIRSLTNLWDVSTAEGNHQEAHRQVVESLRISREVGDAHGETISLVLLGWSEMYLGDFTQAAAHLELALSEARKAGVPRRIALALSALGEVTLRQGKHREAIEYLQESLAINRRVRNNSYIAANLGTLALAAIRQRDFTMATEMLGESLTIRSEVGDRGGVAWCLEKFAQVAATHGDALRGARLLGAAGALREVLGTAVDLVDQAEYDEAIAALRTRLGHAFSRAWEEGQAMTFAEAVACAQSAPPVEEELAGPSHLDPVKLHTGELTGREREIAALIAHSKSNSEIAEELVISKRTVETHITNILSKLDFTSRGQLAAWAIKKGLIGQSD